MDQDRIDPDLLLDSTKSPQIMTEAPNMGHDTTSSATPSGESGLLSSEPVLLESKAQTVEAASKNPLSKLLQISESLQSLPARLKPVEDRMYAYPSGASANIELCTRMVWTAQEDLRLFKSIVRSPEIRDRLSGYRYHPAKVTAAAAANYIGQIDLWTRLLEDIVVSHDIYDELAIGSPLPPAKEAMRVSVSRKAVQYLVILKIDDLVALLREALS